MRNGNKGDSIFSARDDERQKKALVPRCVCVCKCVCAYVCRDLKEQEVLEKF